MDLVNFGTITYHYTTWVVILYLHFTHTYIVYIQSHTLSSAFVCKFSQLKTEYERKMQLTISNEFTYNCTTWVVVLDVIM